MLKIHIPEIIYARNKAELKQKSPRINKETTMISVPCFVGPIIIVLLRNQRIETKLFFPGDNNNSINNKTAQKDERLL